MITHYGLFWSERDVFWGQEGPGGRGELRGRTDPKGKQSGRGRPKRDESEEQRFEDFRNFVGLYCLYSNNLYSNNELLYIGQAGLQTQPTSLFSRLKEHRNDRLAGRWRASSPGSAAKLVRGRPTSQVPSSSWKQSRLLSSTRHLTESQERLQTPRK